MNEDNNVKEINKETYSTNADVSSSEEATVGNISEMDVKMEEVTKKIEGGVKKIFNTKDSTSDYDKKDIENGKLFGCLSYLIAPIPYFTEKKNKFVIYHAKKGLDLLVICISFLVFSSILRRVIRVNKSCWGISDCYKITPWWVEWPLNIVSIVLGILSLIGIINVLNGKAKELPIIGKIKVFK